MKKDDKDDSDSMDIMKESFRKLKRTVADPKVYSLIVKSNRMVILHMGVHYSLDEAFAAVKKRFIEEGEKKDPSKLNLDLWMWEAMPASAVMSKFFGKDYMTSLVLPVANLSTDEHPPAEVSASEYAKQVYDMKNELMRRIIDTKDAGALQEAKSILSKKEIQLIESKIQPQN